MNTESPTEYCLIVEGNYFTEAEVEKALREPFIEDWIEETGNLRIPNFDTIEVAAGIALGWLKVKMRDDDCFEIVCGKTNAALSEHKAKLIAEAVRKQNMFDDVRIEQRRQAS